MFSFSRPLRSSPRSGSYCIDCAWAVQLEGLSLPTALAGGVGRYNHRQIGGNDALLTFT